MKGVSTVIALSLALLFSGTAQALNYNNPHESVPAVNIVKSCEAGYTIRAREKNYKVKCQKREARRTFRFSGRKSSILSGQRPRYRGSKTAGSRVVTSIRSRIAALIEKARLKRQNETQGN